MPLIPICTIQLHYDYDVVAARRRARQIAGLLGFHEQDQTRIATVVSEIARNALRYAAGGRVEFGVDNGGREQSLIVTVSDRGKGIDNLDDILAGRYKSSTGMGIGIVGARRLMDEFAMGSTPEKGTTVVMKKRLAPSFPSFGPSMIQNVVDKLTQLKPDNPLEEMQQQNGELLQALALLNERQEQLERLNQELEDTNRGVLALYAELDEKADHLRRVDQLKTRFLSDMSHEFRTPVNSILALTRILDEGNLEEEARRQVALVRRAASDLASLVNDLLDLAKIEAGKVEIHPAEFEISTLFSALRGMLRPLLLNRSLSLVFDEPENLPVMDTDEAKVSQILRNFISNAIKFTEVGEVRVSALLAVDGDAIIFSVTDTGVGIAPEHHERIFEEFTQIDSPLQRQQRGTGLGLPLTRRLATLLGGSVAMRSEPGAGSTFTTTIPVVYTGPESDRPRRSSVLPATQPAPQMPSRKLRVLVVDDDDTSRYTVGTLAAGNGHEVIEASSGLQGLARAQAQLPDVILLDLMMPGVGGHEVLARLKSDPATAVIPVVIVTSRFVNDEEKQQILARAVSVIYKGDLSRELVHREIERAIASAPPRA
jgi:signal transduction histidine kinase